MFQTGAMSKFSASSALSVNGSTKCGGKTEVELWTNDIFTVGGAMQLIQDNSMRCIQVMLKRSYFHTRMPPVSCNYIRGTPGFALSHEKI